VTVARAPVEVERDLRGLSETREVEMTVPQFFDESVEAPVAEAADSSLKFFLKPVDLDREDKGFSTVVFLR
jgi:hypothetical protein